MNAQQKKKHSLISGILSIVFGFPLFSIIFGVFGLALANSHQKESGLDYKTEKILSILGIVLGIMIAAIFCIVLISQLSGIH